MRKRMVVCACVALALGGAVGCGSDDDESTANAPAETTASPSSTGEAGGEGKGELITLIANVVHPLTAVSGEGGKAAAEKLGMDYKFVQSDGDPATDIALIQDALAQGSKGLIIHVNSPEADAPALEAAMEDGVCVVMQYANLRGIESGEITPGAKAYVGYDEEAQAKSLARAMAEEAGGKGGVVVLNGVELDPGGQERIKGITEEWSENFPDVKILAEQATNFDPSNARALMQGWAEKYGDEISMVFTMDDSLATAAADVIAGIPELAGKVVIGGYGGSKQGLKYVKEGKTFATVPLVPFDDAAIAVELAGECIQGDKEPKVVLSGDLDVLKPFKQTDSIITQENADEFKPQW